MMRVHALFQDFVDRIFVNIAQQENETTDPTSQGPASIRYQLREL
jgi:hypothetical protein